MIQRSQHRVVADQGVISDPDAALILETAAGIDEHVVSEVDILPAVRIERRKESEGREVRLAGQLSHHCKQLLRRMVGIVHLCSDPQRFLRECMHEQVAV